MTQANGNIEAQLWGTADELRANSNLRSSEYSAPVLGLIFLRYADHKFSVVEKELAGASGGRRQIGREDYQARGALFMPTEARFTELLKLTEGDDVGRKIADAMRAIEAENSDLRDVLPKNYGQVGNRTLRWTLEFGQVAKREFGS
ncbi:MAG: type I restriction-modification system subunit M N-terminal domain-containing protein [Chloroflexi bacterium]|nr:type I restriction-modification system subunit M N-terminal domain-containing protein [Chloroflexota bacterium]